jgi:hypothetical protein
LFLAISTIEPSRSGRDVRFLRQPIAFLLGEMLETKHAIGAELMGTSCENFRQLLARARAKLSGFMRGRRGLVDPQAPCRCVRKIQALVRDGIIDPGNLLFAARHGERIGSESRTLAAIQRATLEDLRGLYPGSIRRMWWPGCAICSTATACARFSI